MNRLLGKSTLGCDAGNFIIEDASHTAFRLSALQKFSNSLVLRLCWNVSLSFFGRLKLSFSNDKNIIVGNALELKDLSTRYLFSFC